MESIINTYTKRSTVHLDKVSHYLSKNIKNTSDESKMKHTRKAHKSTYNVINKKKLTKKKGKEKKEFK